LTGDVGRGCGDASRALLFSAEIQGVQRYRPTIRPNLAAHETRRGDCVRLPVEFPGSGGKAKHPVPRPQIAPGAHVIGDKANRLIAAATLWRSGASW